jgi:repressor LexA
MQSIGKLTERQHEVLVHFTDTLRKTGAPPTIRAIKTHFGFSTPRGAEVHLKALAAKGYLIHFPGETPAYRPRFHHGGSTVPLVGRVPAGHPTEQPEVFEGLLAIPWRVSDRAFAVKVVGDSMRDAHILDGDLAVVDPVLETRDGHVVVALLDGEHTIKFLRHVGAGWELEPANADYERLVPRMEGDSLVGRVVAIVRTMA